MDVTCTIKLKSTKWIIKQLSGLETEFPGELKGVGDCSSALCVYNFTVFGVINSENR